MTRKCRFPVIRFEDWPDADQEAWNEAMRDARDILEEPGSLSGFSTKHIVAIKLAYGLWLGFLETDLKTPVGSSGRNYLNQDLIARFVGGLQPDLAPWSVIRYLENVGCAVGAMFPGTNVGFIFKVGLALRRTAHPTRNKRSRLQPSHDLFDLGMELMGRAQSLSKPIKTALMFRDGMMIALLTLRPLRAGNFSSIEIGRHLVDRGGKLWLEFPAEEVKNRRPLEFPFPDQLVEPLHRYLKQHRPTLLSRVRCSDDGTTSALWPGGKGGSISISQLNVIMRKRTSERFGEPINTHLFRDAAATSIAIDDPAHVQIIIRILGHSTLSVSERHYNQATSIEAARRMQAGLRSRYRSS